MTAKDDRISSSHRNLPPGEQLSLVAMGLDTESQGLLKRFVESIPLVRLRTQLDDYRMDEQESFADWIGNPPPDICLIDFDKDRRTAAGAAARIYASAPETAIFALSSNAQSSLIIEAMRSGCTEYLIKPLDREQLLNAVARVGGRRRAKRESHNAQVLAFIGAKGGCGVTTVVTQLGAILAKSFSRKTLLLDLHHSFGDAALYLGVTRNHYHSLELIENTHRLDAEFLASFVVHHSSGMDLIPAPDGSEPARSILPGALAQTLDFLMVRYEFILFDLPPGVSEQSLELLRHSDQIYLITVAEISALRNVARYIDYLTFKEILSEKIRVVVNRHQKRPLITDAQIEKAIRRRIFWKVPNQYPQVIKTISGGDPIAQLSSSEVMQNLAGWAGAIGGKPSPATQGKESRGILGLW
jgi:pilus assembly protein CpaE